MQIPGLSLRSFLSGVLGQSSLNSAPETISPGPAAGSKSLQDLLSPVSEPSSLLAQILESYDVRHITPRQLTEMLQKLREAGFLTEEEFSDLGQIRNDLTEAGIEPDEALDLIRFYQQRLERLKLWQEEQDNPALQRLQFNWQKRLEWLEKVATARQNGLSQTALARYFA